MCKLGFMKEQTIDQLEAVAHQIAGLDVQRDELIARRDQLIRKAKGEGATWDELQRSSGITSPTSVARALKRGA